MNEGWDGLVSMLTREVDDEGLLSLEGGHRWRTSMDEKKMDVREKPGEKELGGEEPRVG